MLEERIAELIQADVDGELEPSDRPELDAALESSEAARRFREEMVRVARLMNELPPVEPPAGLRDRILARIDLPTRIGWPEWMVGWLRPASYGLAVAAGMVLALGIVQIVPMGDDFHDPDIRSLVGSMVARDAGLMEESAQRLLIEAAGLSGQARLSELDSALAVEFELETDEPVEVRVGFEGSDLGFGGFADPQAGVDVVDVSGGDVRVVNEGIHRYVLFLRPRAGTEAAAQAIAIAISRNGETLFRGELRSGG